MRQNGISPRTNATTSQKPQRERVFESKLSGKKPNQKPILSSSFKSQSAMEYLMTYGWAILIIAIVMVALFQLGVFNGTFFAPRATAGACEVYRSVEGINLVGQCQGELPQFVAYFPNINSEVVGPNYNVNLLANSYTMCAWSDRLSAVSNGYFGVILFAVNYANTGLMQENGAGGGVGGWLGGVGGGASPDDGYGTWYQYCVVYSGLGSSSRQMYFDGNPVGAPATGGTPASWSGDMQIGNGGDTCCGLTNVEPTYISNVQFYNTSLSANEISALYLEGIGGAPIDPTHIVGWWPLNGNAQDYSGNNNNGAAAGGVSYSSTWASGYTAP